MTRRGTFSPAVQGTFTPASTRQAINAECRRLGYTPRMILGINR